MKRVGILIFAWLMIFCMAACGSRTGETDRQENKLSSLLEEILSKDYENNNGKEEMPDNGITVPQPPEAESYLTDLWRNYDCTQTSVDVSGLRATYAISASQNNRLIDCEGSYYLILEYDAATGKWQRIDNDWLDREYTFDTDGFAKNSVWFVRPKPGCDGLYLYFDNVTEKGCNIRWESLDEDLTVNGEHTGETYCSFRVGSINDNNNYPCWVLDGLEIEFLWNYYGGKYQSCIYYVQIQCDKIAVPLEDPFSNTTGNASVGRVNQ